MYDDKVVLCGANSYNEKYYLNPDLMMNLFLKYYQFQYHSFYNPMYHQ